MSGADAPDQGCRNLQWSLALFEGLIESGLRHVVLSPGSRSTPLVLAAERLPWIELIPILDERSAAFFALGLAEASGRPVGLVCTSGSALAHWFPAVIEASESGLPLVLLSADRPPEQRGWGANQTIDQTRLFGVFVREFHDLGPPEAGPAALKSVRALGLRAGVVSLGPRPGPVHINLPFREPLVPAGPCGADRSMQRAQAARVVANRARLVCDSAPRPEPHADHLGIDLARLLQGRGVICCGPMPLDERSAGSLFEVGRRLDAPVLTDSLSGWRFGPAPAWRIARYDSLLRNSRIATDLKPDWVIRFGRTAVSKILAQWMEGCPSLLLDPQGRWNDPGHDVIARVWGDGDTLLGQLEALGIGGATEAIGPWIARWMDAERWIDQLAVEFLAQAPWFEGHLIGRILGQLADGDGLYCANSLPIRQLDTWSGQGEKRLRFVGHRGASGIDGQASTLGGINRAWRPASHGVVGLLGDLSFLHDLSGLALLDRLDRPCIVLNNGGGRIFDALPQRSLPGLERFWRTPQRVQISDLANAFTLRHRVVEDAVGFDEAWADALAAAARGDSAGLIEVRLDADSSRRTHETFWDAVCRGSVDQTGYP
jgi:2-succinyl-5-enolpyruvyl-6-hydroxy-3-cyclohexene-1-carboxylate synthase